jgi:predicted nucleic acid-binding protein
VALTIVDSDILIDVARGDADAINCLTRLERTSALAVSAVSRMELIIDYKKSARFPFCRRPEFVALPLVARAPFSTLYFAGRPYEKV